MSSSPTPHASLGHSGTTTLSNTSSSYQHYYRSQEKQEDRKEGLKFRRSKGECSVKEIQKSKIDDVLHSVGKDYKDPRMEPLARALAILGSINAEEELDEVCLARVPHRCVFFSFFSFFCFVLFSLFGWM